MTLEKNETSYERQLRLVTDALMETNGTYRGETLEQIADHIRTKTRADVPSDEIRAVLEAIDLLRENAPDEVGLISILTERAREMIHDGVCKPLLVIMLGNPSMVVEPA